MKTKILTVLSLIAMRLTVVNAGQVDQPAMNGKLKVTTLAPEEACYTGKPYSKELGAYVFNARNYNPQISRWTTPDPSGFPDGANSHSYSSKPTTQVDACGLDNLTLPAEPQPEYDTWNNVKYRTKMEWKPWYENNGSAYAAWRISHFNNWTPGLPAAQTINGTQNGQVGTWTMTDYHPAGMTATADGEAYIHAYMKLQVTNLPQPTGNQEYIWMQLVTRNVPEGGHTLKDYIDNGYWYDYYNSLPAPTTPWCPGAAFVSTTTTATFDDNPSIDVQQMQASGIPAGSFYGCAILVLWDSKLNVSTVYGAVNWGFTVE